MRAPSAKGRVGAPWCSAPTSYRLVKAAVAPSQQRSPRSERGKRELAGEGAAAELVDRLDAWGDGFRHVDDRLSSAHQAVNRLVASDNDLDRFMRENDLEERLGRQDYNGPVPDLAAVERDLAITSRQAASHVHRSVSPGDGRMSQLLLAFKLRNLIKACYLHQVGQPEAAREWTTPFGDAGQGTQDWLRAQQPSPTDEQQPWQRHIYQQHSSDLQLAGMRGAAPWAREGWRWPATASIDESATTADAEAEAKAVAAAEAAAEAAMAAAAVRVEIRTSITAEELVSSIVAAHSGASSGAAVAAAVPPVQELVQAEPLPEAAGEPTASPSSEAPAEAEAVAAPTGQVAVAVQCQTQVGQHVVLVGSVPELGNWKVDEGLPMLWTDGHVWRADFSMLAGGEVEYKAVLLQDGGAPVWMSGNNLKTMAVANQMVEAFARFR